MEDIDLFIKRLQEEQEIKDFLEKNIYNCKDEIHDCLYKLNLAYISFHNDNSSFPIYTK